MKHGFIDLYAGLDSPLHRLDPRIRLLIFFTAIGLIVSEPRGELSPFLFYYVLVIFLLGLSRVPAGFVLKRCLIVSPFILPAAALLPVSLILGGETTAAGFSSGVWHLALSIILKAYAAIVLLTLLISTGKFHQLLKGLRQLKAPALLGVLSALMYRFVFIINDERLRTSLARESRTPGKLRTNRFKVYGNQAAMIFLRSWSRAQVIYSSMQARGFTGNFPDYTKLKIKTRDIVFLLMLTTLFLFIRIYL